MKPEENPLETEYSISIPVDITSWLKCCIHCQIYCKGKYSYHYNGKESYIWNFENLDDLILFKLSL